MFYVGVCSKMRCLPIRCHTYFLFQRYVDALLWGWENTTPGRGHHLVVLRKNNINFLFVNNITIV